MKNLFKRLLHVHRPSEQSIIIFASPRGGSTWITELIASQSGFWPIHEPLNVRYSFPRRELGISLHSELYSEHASFLIEK